MTKTIPKRKKCKKAKWLSEKTLQIAEKRREVKGKGERDRYSQLNADFQRISRRDKKAVLSECKEIEENNRMGKTTDFFKKIGDTKVTFHAKIGTIKDKNYKDLTEADEIKKRWQEYTELYKKDTNDPDNHDGVVTHLEPDMLKCEVKWASGSITINKASGGDGIPTEPFQNLKDDAVKSVAPSIPANLENSTVATGLKKVSFHSNPKEGKCQRMLKLPYIQLQSFHMPARLCSKFSKPGFNNT